MAVELRELYLDICSNYDIQLYTKSFFNKKIEWMHTVEEIDFVPMLHGDELVFNSGLNYVSEEWLRSFIDALNKIHAGGLIIALRDGCNFSQETIDHCNQIRFPLFSASWSTPYIDVMRLFSEILLKNEQKETSLGTALKNAIYYPENEELYRNHFESNGFFRDMHYNVILLSCNAYNTENGNERLQYIKKSLRYIMKKSIIYEEQERLIILTAGYEEQELYKKIRKMYKKDVNVYIGIGTTAKHIKDIHKSYENAYTAYQLTKTAIPKNILSYEELGIYKILSDVKEASIYPEFVRETLGNLMAYDEENDTDYVKILETYFDSECSIINAAKVLYCHKNTLAYKISKIKEILGYDILANENRVKIMVSFYIMRLGAGYF